MRFRTLALALALACGTTGLAEAKKTVVTKTAVKRPKPKRLKVKRPKSNVKKAKRVKPTRHA
jgi:hypothetical protein